MNKKSSTAEDDDPLDREIDFSNVKPNPFAQDYGRNRNLRVLAPDLLAVFPDSDAVNEALRAFMRMKAATPQKISARTATAPKTKKSR